MKTKIIHGECPSKDTLRKYKNDCAKHEDACFGINVEPRSKMLKELIEGKYIPDYYQPSLNKMVGIPNDSLTVKLIDGSSKHEIHKAEKKVGGINPMQFYSSGFNDPFPLDTRLYQLRPMQEMSDEGLLQLAFFPFMLSKYKEIEPHFRMNTGMELKLKLDKWYDGNTGKDKVTDFIKRELHKACAGKTELRQVIQVPDELLQRLNFGRYVFNLSEMIAMGGQQYVELEGSLLDGVKWGRKSWNKQGQIVESPTRLQVQLDYTIGDWFGVSEDDVISKGIAGQLARNSLAALWLLQHQRGYRPFVCFYTYSEILDLRFNITNT